MAYYNPYYDPYASSHSHAPFNAADELDSPFALSQPPSTYGDPMPVHIDAYTQPSAEHSHSYTPPATGRRPPRPAAGAASLKYNPYEVPVGTVSMAQICPADILGSGTNGADGEGKSVPPEKKKRGRKSKKAKAAEMALMEAGIVAADESAATVNFNATTASDDALPVPAVAAAADEKDIDTNLSDYNSLDLGYSPLTSLDDSCTMPSTQPSSSRNQLISLQHPNLPLSHHKPPPPHTPQQRPPPPPQPTPQPQKHVPRPVNCFIIYRKKLHAIIAGIKQRAHLSDRILNNNTISKIVAHIWKHEDEDVRRVFMEFARQAKEKHSAQHPDYKYRPRKTGERFKGGTGPQGIAFSPLSITLMNHLS
ncbi:hypothetical protein HDV00_001807 [Rhizophlyctis rosea]|nr:hypothetical protein HDV00_001807 [Rhizophlyctis rosea]